VLGSEETALEYGAVVDEEPEDAIPESAEITEAVAAALVVVDEESALGRLNLDCC